jgi:hypothetical protein
MTIETIGDLKAALAAFPDDWEVLILNLNTPIGHHIYTLGELRQAHVDAPIVLLPVGPELQESMQRDLDIYDRAVKHGMCSPEEAFDMKRRIRAGEFHRER